MVSSTIYNMWVTTYQWSEKWWKSNFQVPHLYIELRYESLVASVPGLQGHHIIRPSSLQRSRQPIYLLIPRIHLKYREKTHAWTFCHTENSSLPPSSARVSRSISSSRASTWNREQDTCMNMLTHWELPSLPPKPDYNAILCGEMVSRATVVEIGSKNVAENPWSWARPTNRFYQSGPKVVVTKGGGGVGGGGGGGGGGKWVDLSTLPMLAVLLLYRMSSSKNCHKREITGFLVGILCVPLGGRHFSSLHPHHLTTHEKDIWL